MTTDGVLPSQAIHKLIRSGGIRSAPAIAKRQVQPASLDLRLGTKAHRVQASFLPGNGRTVRECIDALGMITIDLTRPTMLETGCIYLVELEERLRLPEDVEAKANPRSTTGRLDVFTRLLTDGTNSFDSVERGYEGPLYAEIMPRTFPVIVRRGTSLSQIRLVRGRAVLNDGELRDLDRAEPLICRDGAATPAEIRNGVRLRVRLRNGGNGPVGYRGTHAAPTVDLEGRHGPERYWEAIRTPARGQLILKPGDFHILVSDEEVRIPPEHAAEMVPFDPEVGELRVHYAGFFDPGFGWSASPGTGSRVVLEVRAHEAPFVLEDRQVVARLEYSRMLARPEELYGDGIGSSYHRQGTILSKQFTAWPEDGADGNG